MEGNFSIQRAITEFFVRMWRAFGAFLFLFETKTEVDFWIKSIISSSYVYPGTFPYPSGLSIDLSPSEYYSDFQNQYVLVLQRGVDPYSPKYKNEYSLGDIFGTNESDPNWTFTAETRLNIPIQRLTNPSTTIQGYNNQSDIFYQSYFFSPGISGSNVSGGQFTGYTTTNTAYYGLLSSEITTTYGTTNNGELITKTSNGFYSNNPNSSFYDGSEDLSGAGLMGCLDYNRGGITPADFQNYFKYSYYTKSIFPTRFDSNLK
jgi:hypothetical protein